MVSIASIGLPNAISSAYQRQGIDTLYSWQYDCLKCLVLDDTGLVHPNKNLVYSAPTSGGKSLVAEILLFGHIFNSSLYLPLQIESSYPKTNLFISRQQTIALFIVPFVSIITEKELYFKTHFKNELRVQSFHHNSTMSVNQCVQSLVNIVRDSQEDKIVFPFDVALCTIEKANGIIHGLAVSGHLFNIISIIIIDELHTIHDEGRGAILNVLLSQMIYYNSLEKNFFFSSQSITEDSDSSEQQTIQIVGMSATLSSLDRVSKWLHAESYHTYFRPLQLQEYILCNEELWLYNVVSSNNSIDSSIAQWTKVPLFWDMINHPASQHHSDHLINIAINGLSTSLNTLIFCPSKRTTETVATSIVESIKHSANKEWILKEFTKDTSRRLLSEQLLQLTVASGVFKNDTMNTDNHYLYDLVIYGVAYHHSGLTIKERNLIEHALRHNIIHIVCATSTIAVGINLPIHRVIFKSPYIAFDFLNSSKYQQMSGRAGRLGYTYSGESIMLCHMNDFDRTKYMIQEKRHPSVPKPLTFSTHSSLCPLSVGNSTICRYLLALMTSHFQVTESYTISMNQSRDVSFQSLLIATSYLFWNTDDLPYLNYLLYYFKHQVSLQDNHSDLQNIKLATPSSINDLSHLLDSNSYLPAVTLSALDVLIQMGQIQKQGNERYQATRQGIAISSVGINSFDGYLLLTDIDKLSNHLILDSEIHLAYLCCPLICPIQLNWSVLHTLIGRLKGSDRLSLETLGIDTSVISFGAASHNTLKKNIEQRHLYKLSCYHRLYTALLCVSLIRAFPIQMIMKTFHITYGEIQSLQFTVGSFGTMTLALCEQLGWWPIATLLESFLPLLKLGTSHDYLNLMTIKGMTLPLAKAFHRGRLRTVESISSSSVVYLERCLIKSGICRGRKGQIGTLLAKQILYSAKEQRKHTALELIEEQKNKFVLTLQDPYTFFKQDYSIDDIDSKNKHNESIHHDWDDQENDFHHIILSPLNTQQHLLHYPTKVNHSFQSVSPTTHLYSDVFHLTSDTHQLQDTWDQGHISSSTSHSTTPDQRSLEFTSIPILDHETTQFNELWDIDKSQLLPFTKPPSDNHITPPVHSSLLEQTNCRRSFASDTQWIDELLNDSGNYDLFDAPYP